MPNTFKEEKLFLVSVIGMITSGNSISYCLELSSSSPCIEIAHTREGGCMMIKNVNDSCLFFFSP